MDAAERWRVLRLHVEDPIPLAVLARETGISARTLQRWNQLYRAGGVASLDPHARIDKGVRRTSAETVAFIEQLALSRPRPSLATLHRLAVADAQARELRARSYATVRQIVQALDPALVTLALEGPVSYRDKHELVFRRRAEHPNQTWQSDHTELDILIVGADGKPDRPWLTTVMDDYSRAICGYMVFGGAPSAINTALALRQAIWRKTDPAWAMCGIPDILHVDHGSDFISHHLERTAIALHIRIIHSTVGRPQGRGKIERFFGTINTELLSALPGHLGPGSLAPTPILDLAGLDRRSANLSAPTTTGPIASWGSRRETPGSRTDGCHGCPTASKNSTDCSSLFRRTGSCNATVSTSKASATSPQPWHRSSATPSRSGTTPATSPRFASMTGTRSSVPLSMKPTPTLRLSLRDIETARRARRKQLRRAINDRIPTVATREEPRIPEPTKRRPKLRTYEEDE